MATLLLIIIYIAFISLGLPDAVLGASWPVMHKELAVPIELAGLLQMTIAGGTIVSSMNAGRVLRRFGTGRVTTFSVALTAAALLGFSFFPSFVWYFIAAIPLGIGAGAVDTGLNAFVAQHYQSRHMSWLHSFWGVGALGGPLILSRFLASGGTWREAYRSIGTFQWVLVVILIASLPLWRRLSSVPASQTPGEEAAVPEVASAEPAEKSARGGHPSMRQLLSIRGVPFALLSFLFYCGLESSMGLWGGSWLVTVKGLDPADAAFWVMFFYIGIAGGRFLTGFATSWFTNRDLVRWGTVFAGIGVLILLLPLPLPLPLAGILLVGLGCAPVFPCLIHETPAFFGPVHAQGIIGLQMSAAYIGVTFFPPFFGGVSRLTGLGFFPVFLLAYGILLLVASERLRTVRANN